MLADDEKFLNETRLSDIAGVSRGRRSTWARVGHLRRAARYGETDAVELSAFAELVDRLGFEDAVLAWDNVRVSIREHNEERELLVVFDLRVKTGALVSARAAIGDHVIPGHHFCVVDLTQRVRQTRATCRRLRDAHARAAA